MQIDAGQRTGKLAELRADALAIDDEERRAKLAHQPADMDRLERINKAFAPRHAHIN